MKRVYAAAGLMVAVGAAIGYMLAPQAPADEPAVVEQSAERAPPESRDAGPRRHGGGGGGGGGFLSAGGGGQNLLEKTVASKTAEDARPDCYFMRVSYRTLSRGGAETPKAREAANQLKQAGCALGL